MKLSISSEFRKVALITYTISAEVVEKYLPDHTKLDFYNGECLISLVGFQVQKLKVSGVKLPLLKDFEEIDLQIYVKRFDGAKWRKGVVVIKRIFDQPGAAALTNTIFKTNYTSLQATGTIKETEESLVVKYSWQYNKMNQNFQVRSSHLAAPYDTNTEAAFLLDRPYGYLKAGEKTFEYQLDHVDWHLYTVEEYAVDIDFSRQFDPAFNLLNEQNPRSVILTEGSTVEIGENQLVTS
ncbi:DUF2071 domain-containing protein [Salinimicrobium sp. TH3]|uniref:DUF2071 domain-containing protein n=1 Tax=Salinimicrobium sp. TH3 TaxID=2997342 RepID=UPI002274814F|nr:DUF2071 domain-containing protein [Salinimicrobium sp. TH3]MCY2687409.1 DUF2071 domain-containing protein [Salinimicrobium sp. TH3]